MGEGGEARVCKCKHVHFIWKPKDFYSIRYKYNVLTNFETYSCNVTFLALQSVI